MIMMVIGLHPNYTRDDSIFRTNEKEIRCFVRLSRHDVAEDCITLTSAREREIEIERVRERESACVLE